MCGYYLVGYIILQAYSPAVDLALVALFITESGVVWYIVRRSIILLLNRFY